MFLKDKNVAQLNRTLDPKIQSPTLNQLSQGAPQKQHKMKMYTSNISKLNFQLGIVKILFFYYSDFIVNCY